MVARIIRAFGCAAGEGIVPQSIHQGLELIDTLVAGRREDVWGANQLAALNTFRHSDSVSPRFTRSEWIERFVR